MFSKFAPKYAAVALSVIAAMSMVGCKQQSAPAQRGPQEVTVVTVTESSPVMTTELSGRTSAYQVAEVRPQINGIIQKRTFVEGQMVKEGDQLYQIDPALYEAATIDGASRFKKILYISIPSLIPTIMILLIMRIGSIMNVGFEKVLLMQNPINKETIEIISTFIYTNGIQQGQFSYSSAAGLFNSAINCVLLVIANKVSKKVTGSSLW